jgi:hypothetical protein
VISHRTLIALAIAASAVPAAAAPLPCVQRAIDWGNSATNHEVRATLVSLYENGAASWTVAVLKPILCLNPIGTCLGAANPNTGQLSPFNTVVPFQLTVNTLRPKSENTSSLSSGSANYNITQQSCVGNLLVGTDQYGNHWTVSFVLGFSPVIH